MAAQLIHKGEEGKNHIRIVVSEQNFNIAKGL